MRRALAAFVAAGALVTACGGGTQDERVEDGVRTLLLGDETFPSGAVTESEAECAAAGLVEEFGVDRLTEIGVNSEGGSLELQWLTDDELDRFVRIWQGCIDDVEAFVVRDIRADLLAEQDPGLPLDGAKATCLAEGIVDAFPLDRVLALGLRSDEQPVLADLTSRETDRMAAVILGCIDVRGLLLAQVRAGGLHADVVECIDEQITDDDVAALFTTSLRDGAMPPDAFESAIDACS